MKIFFSKLKNGFTLTELLVVSAVIMIMSGVSLIYLSNFSPHAKLKGEANQIVNEIRKTQNFALTEQLIYVIRFNKNDNNYSIINASYETTVETITLTHGINFIDTDCYTSGICEVRYNSAGTPLSPETITIQNSKGQQLTINVQASGYVKIL